MPINKYSSSVNKSYINNVQTPVSRYDKKTRLKTKDNITIRLMRKRDLTFDDSNSNIHIVTQIEAYRPDIIAFNTYGSETYAWVILAANNLTSFFQLAPGTKIVLPSLVSLWGTDGKMVTS